LKHKPIIYKYFKVKDPLEDPSYVFEKKYLYIIGLNKNLFFYITSSITLDKYFILTKHWSKVLPVAPTSIIHAAFPKC